jgi:ElaB/YqjD/DUF883 family membrane-anchored ribosome-binding protein
MTQHHTTDAAASPAQLEHEVNEARSRLSETVDALEARLSPERLFDQAVSAVRVHGGETVSNLGLSIKQNPAALLLVGGGLLWLLKGPGPQASATRHLDLQGDSSASTSDGPSVADRLTGAARAVKSSTVGARDGARESWDRATGAASSAADSTRRTLHEASATVQARAHQASTAVSRLVDEQPLVLGAIGLAIGAAIGGLLPTTRREGELLGEARDQVVGNLQTAASEKLTELRTKVTDSLSPDGSGSNGASTDGNRPVQAERDEDRREATTSASATEGRDARPGTGLGAAGAAKPAVSTSGSSTSRSSTIGSGFDQRH